MTHDTRYGQSRVATKALEFAFLLHLEDRFQKKQATLLLHPFIVHDGQRYTDRIPPLSLSLLLIWATVTIYGPDRYHLSFRA